MGMKPANRTPRATDAPKRGRGRPPFPPGEARNIRLQISLNEREEALLTVAAEAGEFEGLHGLASYVRACALSAAKKAVPEEAAAYVESIAAGLSASEG